MSALDNTALLGGTVDEEVIELHEPEYSDERNEINASTAGDQSHQRESPTLPFRQALEEARLAASQLRSIQEEAAKENAASEGPTATREVWNIPGSQKSIPQPDANRIVLSGSRSLRHGTTTYHYADELSCDEKWLFVLTCIMALLGTPLTLLCTLPAIYFILQVSAMQIRAKYTYYTGIGNAEIAQANC